MDTTRTNAQRADLHVTVQLSAGDSGLTTALGWSRGTLGAAQVVIQRLGGLAMSANADSDGVATFAQVLPGVYVISAGLVLSDSERALLDASDQDVDAFAGGGREDVNAPVTAVTIPVTAGRRGSLVIGEIDNNEPYDGASGYYTEGQYVEVFNNTDSTLFLDGKTIGVGLAGGFDFPNYPCTITEPFNDDSLGILSYYFYKFPGTGRDHPIGPGRSAVLATDAIDHSRIVPGGLDLSNADFEFRGSKDVDNPAVPDMISLGPRDGGMAFGHGLFFHEVREVVFLADSLTPAALADVRPTWITLAAKRIPAEKLLDVVTLRYILNVPYQECAGSVNTRFDSQEAELLTGLDALQTIHRRLARTLSDGRAILQRTKTSARDFVVLPPSPGTIP